MKKIVFLVLICFFLFIINNFFHSIYRLWQKQDLITTARKELTQAKSEQRSLENQLREVQNPSYIEEEARNKLFLVKPGEQVVVLPSTTVTEEVPTKTVKKEEPAWLQWYNVFF